MTVVHLGEKERPRRSSLFRRQVTPGVLLLVILGLVVFRIWILEMAIVDGPSMEGTLLENDRVLVLKPMPVERFDVVVFRDPEEGIPVIKRVVAVPGDVVEIEPHIVNWQGEEIREGGQLYVNGTAYDEPYAKSVAPIQLGPLTVPRDRYFVLGDNRDESIDSRAYGAVPGRSIHGVAAAIVYPFSRAGKVKGGAEPAGPMAARAEVRRIAVRP